MHFLEWKCMNISLKYIPRVPNNNIPTLLQIMAWRRPDDKPLSEPMMVNLLTHTCVIRPQWVNVRSPVIFQSIRTKEKLKCWAYFWACCYDNQELVSLSVIGDHFHDSWRPKLMVILDWGRYNFFTWSDTWSWISQPDSHERFRYFEILIDALAEIMMEIKQLKYVTYFVTWWRHRWRHECVI